MVSWIIFLPGFNVLFQTFIHLLCCGSRITNLQFKPRHHLCQNNIKSIKLRHNFAFISFCRNWIIFLIQFFLGNFKRTLVIVEFISHNCFWTTDYNKMSSVTWDRTATLSKWVFAQCIFRLINLLCFVSSNIVW